ncbi:MAG: hypothetical protein CVU56_12450 [Deltaproteobacteria bacterium HGW-Deltaproteobacteria-14]|nr:MAG: hypothetical protein CVU56_12450 [Deltaproteobacteria bacterium HGW-Deltaproteobacteria-14]
MLILPLAATLTWACGSGGHVITPEEAAPPPVEVMPPAPDAFRDFSGDRVDAGTRFEVDGVGRGVRGVEAVVRVEQVKTSIWYAPSGEEKIEGTATIIVEKGQERARLRLKDGEEDTAIGVHVLVHEAKVAYDERRMDYVPKAWVTVTAAP